MSGFCFDRHESGAVRNGVAEARVILLEQASFGSGVTGSAQRRVERDVGRHSPFGQWRLRPPGRCGPAADLVSSQTPTRCLGGRAKVGPVSLA
jgi:hypothetical protein